MLPGTGHRGGQVCGGGEGVMDTDVNLSVCVCLFLSRRNLTVRLSCFN